MSVHACFFGIVQIFFEYVGSHGNNWKVCLNWVVKASYGPGCLVSIHDRHLYIHKY